MALILGFLCTAILFTLNAKKVTHLSLYLLVGLVLWFAVLKSGVHATLAGVVIGFAIPIKGDKPNESPLKTLEHWLHPYVSFGILPLFALANAGIALNNVSISGLTSALPMGIAFGLLVGKPIGIMLFSWVAVKMKWARMPHSVGMRHIFAVSILCGIGFTMSIFISSLAFGFEHEVLDTYARLGILMGSTASAILGYSLLAITLPKPKVVMN